MRSACPSERSPSRVAGFWLPAPPMPFTRERAGLRGLSRDDFPSLRRAPGPLVNFGPSTGFPTGHSGRPVSGSTPPMGFFAPTTNSARRSGSPGLASPGTFRPQGLDTLSSVYSLLTDPILGSDTVLGVHPSGLCTFRPAAPVSGPWSSCRFRPTRPFPLRTKRSSGPPRLQDFAPTEKPFPSGRSSLPSGPCPRGSPSSPKLWPLRAEPGFPGPPLMCFLAGSGRSRRRRRHSRVSGAARFGGLSRVHRLP